MADYRKMWEELGMDVKTHDLLCAALPGAFGDVYLSQENRPEGMDFFNMVVADIHGIRPQELVDFQKKGGKVVGSFCIHVPDEVVIAAGAIATGLCSGSQFWVPDGEKVLPTATCPLIKASLGARFGKTCPFFRICDLFVGETTCDGKKKGYIKKNEKLTGNKVTPASLKKAIEIVNNKRKALQRLNNFRKLENIPISGKDVLLIHQIAFYDDPIRFATMVNKLCDELETRKKQNVSVFKKGTKRILLTGTPLSIPNWKIHHIIETTGGAVVCEEMCTGIRYCEALVDETGNTIDEMVNNLTKRYLGHINCACFTPNKERIDDIIRLAKEYKADGVIDLNLKFCNIYDTEGYFVEKALREHNIPCLGIETDYTDEDAEQLKTRIGAFIEMLR